MVERIGEFLEIYPEGFNTFYSPVMELGYTNLVSTFLPTYIQWPINNGMNQ